MIAIATPPPAVTLDRWQCPVFGDRHTLTHEGKSVLTFGTEFEARRAARDHGWQIVTGDAFGTEDDR